MKTITIVGAGMMGSALSLPARDNGHSVRVVGTHLDRAIVDHAKATRQHLTMKRPLPEGIRYFHIEELDQALDGADVVIGGVSSFGVEWFAGQVVPHIAPGTPILSVTKGLLDQPDGSLKTFPAYYAETCGPRHSFNAIGGPCTSYELADRRHSAVTFCGDEMTVLRGLRALLETDYYHISLSTDVMGVECAVALKNAYALAVSLAIGMVEQQEGEGCTLAYNPQAALFGQSVREMAKMLALTGGGPENIVYAAGDLYVTIFGGRTRKLGTLLGKGFSFEAAMAQLSGITLESVVIANRTIQAMQTLSRLGKARAEEFPLLFHVGRLLQGETGIDIPWQRFEVEQGAGGLGA